MTPKSHYLVRKRLAVVDEVEGLADRSSMLCYAVVDEVEGLADRSSMCCAEVDEVEGLPRRNVPQFCSHVWFFSHECCYAGAYGIKLFC